MAYIRDLSCHFLEVPYLHTGCCVLKLSPNLYQLVIESFLAHLCTGAIMFG